MHGIFDLLHFHIEIRETYRVRAGRIAYAGSMRHAVITDSTDTGAGLQRVVFIFPFRILQTVMIYRQEVLLRRRRFPGI